MEKNPQTAATVAPGPAGWQATLTPVYAFPLMDGTGRVIGWERRSYPDVVVLEEDGLPDLTRAATGADRRLRASWRT